MLLFVMSFFDIMMLGYVSLIDLVGVVIGISIWILVSMGLIGILMVIIFIVV